MDQSRWPLEHGIYVIPNDDWNSRRPGLLCVQYTIIKDLCFITDAHSQ